MKFTKLASLFALIALAVISMSITSAAVLSFNPTSISQTVSAGQSIVVSVNVTYANASANSTSLTWTPSLSAGTITLGAPASLANGQTFAMPVTINIPSSASGIVVGSVNVSGNSNSFATLPVTITVLQSSSSNITIAGPSEPITVGSNATLTVLNSGSGELSVTMSEITSPRLGVTFSPTTFNVGSSPVQVQASTNSLTNVRFGLNDVIVRADAGTQIATRTFQVRKTFCSAGQSTNTNVSISDVDWTNSGEGEDNNWELLDEIEVEVEVENNNNDDDIDVVVEIGLFDSSGRNVADDLVFLEESDSDNEEIEINVDDDDSETVQWTFKVPADFDQGSYKLAVKAYDDDQGETRSCVDLLSGFSNSFYQSIEVEEASDESRFVVVDDIEVDSQVTCGQTISGQFTVFNVGEEDQDRVKILIRNDELNIDDSVEITDDLDQGDDQTLDFTVHVPVTAENGIYTLEFITQYDYRNGVYREDSESSFDANFEVIGCSQPLGNPGSGGTLTNLEIDAELDSDAKAGEELVVKVTLTNTGEDDATFSISARGYSEWAELTDISDGSVSLDAGESQDVTLTFMVNEDAVGSQSFDVQVASGGRVQIQEVEVELGGKSGFNFSLGGSFIWIIAIVNLALIIVIIVVAVRLANR